MQDSMSLVLDLPQSLSLPLSLPLSLSQKVFFLFIERKNKQM